MAIRHWSCWILRIHMRRLPVRAVLMFVAALFLSVLRFEARAGGSGLNVAVVVNQASSNSVEVGNYYCERRRVPLENVFRISWSGGNTTWTLSDFRTLLLDPLLAGLAQRGLTNQIRYVVLSMDIPFSVSDNGQINSTTSALFYGFKDTTKGNDNSYAGSEGAFGEVFPASAPGYSFLTTMITAGTPAQARHLIDQGVDSDATYPTQTVLLAKSTDPLRNVRYRKFDNAIFSTRLLGGEKLQRIDSNVVAGRSDLLGFETGLASFSISPDTFIPGAMADSMTSYGGVIFGPNSQTTLLAFIHAGAAGSYGTVTEPGAVVSKFPDPLVYFYQARGFSLAECYYQAVDFPHQGLIVGEPLAAPYRHAGAGNWLGVASNAVLSGTAPLSVEFTAADASRPLQRVDLFVDGRYFDTLTNIAPTAGNKLHLSFVGGEVDYTVPAAATLGSIASGLADAINTVAASSPANILATAHGDRIEVRSLSDTRPRSPDRLATSTAPPAHPSSTGVAATLASSTSGTAPSVSTFLTAARESSLESSAFGVRACTLAGAPEVGEWLRVRITKTDGTTVAIGVTNQSPSATLLDIAGQLADLINSTPGLQQADGIRVEDLYAVSTYVTFNLRTRAPGFGAAGLRFALTASAGLTITPADGDLRENVDDLLPRNHIYVRAGATDLSLNLALDTTRLEDGYHELTAVAYEGSHVRTQTQTSVPVRVQNTSLSANLTMSATPDPAPVAGTYQVDVTANQSGITAIRLFSTGGELDTVSGQSSSSFTFSGTALGAGLHPIYALVEAANGDRYRTATHWIRLVANP